MRADLTSFGPYVNRNSQKKTSDINVIFYVCVWGRCRHESYNNEFWHIARSCQYNQSYKFWRRWVTRILSYGGPKLSVSRRKAYSPYLLSYYATAMAYDITRLATNAIR
jgi:hypothetical protein